MTDNGEWEQRHPDTYYYTVWFTACDTEDILATLYRDPKGLFLEVRLRTYDPTDPDNEPWSGKDDKRFTRYTLQERSLLNIPSIVKKALDVYTKTWPSVAVRDRVEINGRADALAEKLGRKRWVHAKTFDSQEAAKAWVEQHQKKQQN